jgi:lipid-binding SYLF domain-containing protein
VEHGSPRADPGSRNRQPLAAALAAPNIAFGADKAKEQAEVRKAGQDALAAVYKLQPSARKAVESAKALGASAHAILVFPKVTKAGVGGQFGEGALLQKGKAVAYNNTGGASIGLQAGVQRAATELRSTRLARPSYSAV